MWRRLHPRGRCIAGTKERLGRYFFPVALALYALAGQSGVARGADVAPLKDPLILTVPVGDGTTYLGDIALSIGPQDRFGIPSARLLRLLQGIVDAETLKSAAALLDKSGSATLHSLSPLGIAIRYDPKTIALILDIPAREREIRSVNVASLTGARLGVYEPPAAVSAYLNMRGSLGYVEAGSAHGLELPQINLDGAARYRDVVLEAQAYAQPGSGSGASAIRRLSSRLVYDDLDTLIRWSAGDLAPVARGFQSAPAMAGLSFFRSYGVLAPEEIARPTGRESFTLDQASTVEIWVNDRMAQRLRLGPGRYDLRDFPLTQSLDNVRIAIRDDTGRTQNLNFNIYADQSQLAEGLSEFGFFAGTKTFMGSSGPTYSSDPVMTGFYRRGIADDLTLGGNFQIDSRSLLGGMETVFASQIGTFSGNFAVSHQKGADVRVASALTFQTRLRHEDGTWDSVNISAEYWDRNFQAVDLPATANPYRTRLGISLGHDFAGEVFANLDFRYAQPWTGPDYTSLRFLVGWHPTSELNLTAETAYENPVTSNGGHLVFRLALNWQMDLLQSASANLDSGEQLARLSYNRRSGEGAGSYAVTGSVENSRANTAVNASADLLTSQAELGLDQISTFANASRTSLDSRTLLRFGTSVAYADGIASLGRPIYDSFAIVTPNKSLKNASVVVDPVADGEAAETSLLGAAIQPDLASYSERTIRVEAPDAPAQVDLGKGAFRVMPAYRSGYRLEVGSDYSMSVSGRLFDATGDPLSLSPGTAVEDGGTQSVEMFTGRDGHFSVAGLRPGHWRLRMQDGDAVLVYGFQISADAEINTRLGDMRPLTSGGLP